MMSHSMSSVNIDLALAGPQGPKLIIRPVKRKQELAGTRQSGQQVRSRAQGRLLLLFGLVNNTEHGSSLNSITEFQY